MQLLIESTIAFFSNPNFLLCSKLLACLGKIYVFFYLYCYGLFSRKSPQPLLFLLGILIGEIVVDSSWICNFLWKFYLHNSYSSVMLFIIRWAWAFELIKFQALSLFIESLGEKRYKIRFHQKILILLNACFIGYFIFISFFYFNTLNALPSVNAIMMRLSAGYTLVILTLPSLYVITRKLRDVKLPKILKKQITMLLKFLIFPYFVSQAMEIIFFDSPQHAYIATFISAPLLTIAIFYSLRKVMGLRFLNFESHVQHKQYLYPIDNFKTALEQLSHTLHLNELSHITQRFFKEEFRIQPSRLVLRIRIDEVANNSSITLTDALVENFINQHSNQECSVNEFVKKHKILIADEIDFSNFYEEDKTGQEISKFLNNINADIFLPIFEQESLLAYIIVERDARPEEFFSGVERDQMIVFANYLANIINLLKNRDLEAIIQREKQLHEELLHKHQEINQYRESIRSFLRDTQHRPIGVIFYKNRKFVFGNQAAKELISVNINQQEGHPLTQLMRKLATQVEMYKTNQSCLAFDPINGKLALSALLNIEQNNVIIIVHYPEIFDLIKQQIDLLKNPSEWDYLLYLQTTHSGQLINQLIPGTGNTLLNFKIELLKLALSTKALLLTVSEEDIMPMVEIFHYISMRQTLHTLVLTANDKGLDTAIKLFGINQILGQNPNQKALLEQLHGIGTLFIKNIHFLNLDAQNALADYIKYGYYRLVKSDKKVTSDVRIICSTNQNLQTLVHNGQFSQNLFNALQPTTLNMPSFLVLPKEELHNLIDGFTEQAIASPLFKNLLELSSSERFKLVHTPPASIAEFKTRVQQLLIQKSKKKNLYDDIAFNPAYHVTDPDLIEAKRLGKEALKDQKIMGMLWHKFKNQNKIAEFLGVNRSSVNRRCKEFNLH